MALVTFISKDGSRFELDIPQCTHKVELHGSTDKVTGEEVAVLARAMFDRRLSAEAARRGEGNVERALQVMWDRTKTDVRDTCMLEAEQTLSLRKPKPRTYRLHTSKAGQTLYIEFGCVFVDLAPKTTAEALDGAIQADIEQQKAELTKRHGLYGVKPTKDKLQGQRVGALNELQKVREMKEAMKALRRNESAEKVQAEWADKPWTNATALAQAKELGLVSNDYIFRQGEYKANPAPGSSGIWPLEGWNAGDGEITKDTLKNSQELSGEKLMEAMKSEHKDLPFSAPGYNINVRL